MCSGTGEVAGVAVRHLWVQTWEGLHNTCMLSADATAKAGRAWHSEV